MPRTESAKNLSFDAPQTPMKAVSVSSPLSSLPLFCLRLCLCLLSSLAPSVFLCYGALVTSQAPSLALWSHVPRMASIVGGEEPRTSCGMRICTFICIDRRTEELLVRLYVPMLSRI